VGLNLGFGIEDLGVVARINDLRIDNSLPTNAEISGSASLDLTNYSRVDILDEWCESVNFRAKKHPVLPEW